MIHSFHTPTEGIALPKAFTFPFHYTPHPLTRLAADEVRQYLLTRDDWQEELRQGKMFGVLVIKDTEGKLGYLAAFSGNLAGSNHHAFFVPPVYDLLQPDGFFRIEEAEISGINHRIAAMEASEAYCSAQEEWKKAEEEAQATLASEKQKLKEAKNLREQRRKEGISPEEAEAMSRESQFQKAEFKRLERRLKEKVQAAGEAFQAFKQEIQVLRRERKTRSAALQMRLFAQFRMLNARGEVKDLCEIFRSTPQKTPPAGAGECALPKLLQYAYLHQLQPLAMGEFWWGMSPKDEIRREGHFYPSCKGKCEPILKHMLVGLNVEPNPLEEDVHRQTALEILYEDEWLVVVHKPAGMLSVPGKNDLDSILQRLHNLYPKATGPLIVHRLDMATSGLLLAAKTKEVHKELQALFETRLIQKRYTALLEGELETDEGIIDLPICPNPMDRPRQMVSREYGKRAVTSYRVLERKGGSTRVTFYPHTGRTHQLRVHAAHPEGLNHPIVGDDLYGQPSDRLYLHAASLEFVHPVTGEKLHIVKEADF